MPSTTSPAVRPRRRAASTALVLGIAACCTALAQTDPAYPPATADGAAPLSAKQMFANTLAAVTQTAGTAVVASLQQGLTDWFNRKLGAATAFPANPSPPQPQHPGHSEPHPNGPGYPSDPQATYDESHTGQAPDYESNAGQPVVQDHYSPGHGDAPALYAGLAYEIHLLVAGGDAQPVNPTNHEFRTGDRFVVYYRPTLPGQVLVYNVNPLGRESLIDEAAVAAGGLAQLGPYEFAGTRGDELLRLVLRPCSTPMLAGATRDIVRVADTDTTGAPALAVATCATVATRSLGVTRDIRKVASDGTTGYALDALSPQEVATGDIGAREITIALRHR